jgi:uncharacterized radical SAM superfamily protein
LQLFWDPLETHVSDVLQLFLVEHLSILQESIWHQLEAEHVSVVQLSWVDEHESVAHVLLFMQ